MTRGRAPPQSASAGNPSIQACAAAISSEQPAGQKRRTAIAPCSRPWTRNPQGTGRGRFCRRPRRIVGAGRRWNCRVGNRERPPRERGGPWMGRGASASEPSAQTSGAEPPVPGTPGGPPPDARFHCSEISGRVELSQPAAPTHPSDERDSRSHRHPTLAPAPRPGACPHPPPPPTPPRGLLAAAYGHGAIDLALGSRAFADRHVCPIAACLVRGRSPP